MDITKLPSILEAQEERIKKLEKSNQFWKGKFKKVVTSLKALEERLEIVEAKPSDTSSGIAQDVSYDPMAEDPYVLKHPSGRLVVSEAYLLSITEDYATFRLPDGRGFVVTKDKWCDPREEKDWNDLQRKSQGQYIINETINIDLPIKIHAFVYERYNWKVRVKHSKYGWGNIYTSGILNRDALNAEIDKGGPYPKTTDKHGKELDGEKIEKSFDLSVLPWHFNQAFKHNNNQERRKNQ